MKFTTARAREHSITSLGQVAASVFLFAAACAFVISLVLDSGGGLRFVDWHSYESAAQRFRESGQIYAPFQLLGPYRMADVAGDVFLYPPPALVALLPVSVGVSGLLVWLAIGAVVLLSGLAQIVRRESRIPLRLAMPTVLIVLGISRSLPQALYTANASMLVAGLLAWSYVGQSTLSGFVAGLKVTPIAIAAVGGLRPLVWAGAGLTVVSLLTLPFVGLQNWAQFLQALSNADPACGPFESVACVLAPITGVMAAKALSLVLAGGLVACALWSDSREARLGLVTVALLISTLELQWTSHYLLYAAPSILLICVRALVRLRPEISRAARADPS